MKKDGMIAEIDRLTEKIWNEHKTKIEKHPHCKSINLGWHGGYRYSIIEQGKRISLSYPFKEPLKYLTKNILQKILDILSSADKEWKKCL